MHLGSRPVMANKMSAQDPRARGRSMVTPIAV